MATRVGIEPVVRQKARMPPSTIPQAQVQQIIAELRAAEVHPDVPREYAEPERKSRSRPVMFAVAFLVVGGLIGAAVNTVRPNGGLFHPRAEAEGKPTALSMTTPVPIKAVAPTPAAAPPPIVAQAPPAVQAAAPAPPPKVLAAAQPTLRPPVPLDTVKTVAAPVKPCLAGGACGPSDVGAAESRLQSAFRAAQNAGASPNRLASVRQRWNSLKARAAYQPRTTVAGYRKLTAELSAKPAAKPVAKLAIKRRTAVHSEPLPFRRAR
jgi:hypothetical protein